MLVQGRAVSASAPPARATEAMAQLEAKTTALTQGETGHPDDESTTHNDDSTAIGTVSESNEPFRLLSPRHLSPSKVRFQVDESSSHGENFNIDEMMLKIQDISERLTDKNKVVVDSSATTKKSIRRERRKKTEASLVKLAQELQKRTDEVELNNQKVALLEEKIARMQVQLDEAEVSAEQRCTAARAELEQQLEEEYDRQEQSGTTQEALRAEKARVEQNSVEKCRQLQEEYEAKLALSNTQCEASRTDAENWSARVKELEQEAETLKETNQAGVTKVHELEETCVQLRDEVKEGGAKLKASEEESQARQHEVGAKIMEIGELQAKFEALEATMSEQQQTNECQLKDQYEAQLTETKTTCDELTKKSIEVMAELGDVRTDKSHAKKEVLRLQAHVKELESAMLASAEASLDKEQAAESMKGRVQALEAKLMTAEEEIAPRLAEATAASEKLQTEIEALRADESQSQKEIKRLRATIAELESAMLTTTKSSLTNIETAELLQKRMEELESALRHADEKAQGYERELETARDNYEYQLAASKAICNKLKQDTKQMHSKLSGVKEERETAIAKQRGSPVAESVGSRSASGAEGPSGLWSNLLLLCGIGIVTKVLYTEISNLSMDTVCGPAKPGLVLKTEEAAISMEAPFWAPDCLKETAFAVVCGDNRPRSKLIWSEGKLQHYDLSSASVEDDDGSEAKSRPTWKKRAASIRTEAGGVALLSRSGQVFEEIPF